MELNRRLQEIPGQADGQSQEAQLMEAQLTHKTRRHPTWKSNEVVLN